MRISDWSSDVCSSDLFVRAKQDEAPTPAPGPRVDPGAIVIVGGGAAGFAAAQRLRELGFGGRLSMPSADADAPCDRPNLSKDYLAGTADDDWIPLQGPEFYAEHDIDLRLGCEVTAIETAARQVHLGTGERLDYN